MGCANSKLDDLPAVALCRDRCTYLDEAIHHRYALAEAHIAYMQSLKGVGFTLPRFFDQDVDIAMSKAPLSPLLPLPKDRKGGDLKFAAAGPSGSPEASALPHHLHSNSGSHIQFHSDSDDDDGSHGSFHHSGNSSPFHDDGYPMDHEVLGGFPSSFQNINYMKNQATPAVTYEQRPMGQETVYMGESSHGAYRYPYPYPNSNPNPSSYPYNGYQNYGGNPGYFGGPQPPYGGGPGPVVATEEASSSKPPPPPPSPPSTSAWDFLNPFESYEKFYSHYTPSRNSKDVRDEEGIPDLEDEDYQHEDVKEVHGNQKFVGNGGGAANYSKSVVDDEGGKGGDREALYQTRPKVSVDNNPPEFEVHMVEKKVVDNEDKAGDGGNVAAFKGRGGSRGIPEVLREIQAQFDRASESGSELAKMLEVGKLPYHRKHVAYQVSSKMLHVITPLSVVSSHPSTSTNAESSSSAGKAGSALLDFDEDVGVRLKTLSSTLQKLHLWEKKLYNEVKAEEKMRVVHEKKCRKLKHLDERGAEAHKVDVTRTLIRSLSTKIKISIQVVDKISLTINKIRDEELWPRINELIHGLTRMWKSMLECHHSQYQAIIEARSLDAIASHKKPSDAHLEATWQLEHELIHWISSFSVWVGAQKGYVIALNNWLRKCLPDEPEETADGPAPFSPGRMGAPPVFVICNQWSQIFERISEKEVIDSMRLFATSVHQLCKRDKELMRQRMMANKDLERKVRNLDKEIQTLDKMMVLVSGDGNGLSLPGQVVYLSDTSNSISLQASLQHTFEAMERFTADSMKAYEELLQRSEEDRIAQEQGKVS